MIAAAPIAARRFGDTLRRAGQERARVIFPSALFAGRILDFARDVLGIRTIVSHQREVLVEYQSNPRASILVCTGQKMGKTEIMLVAAAYDFAAERNVEVWVFGPKVDHTNAVFWPRFAKAVINAYYPCPDCTPAHRAWCALVEVDPLDETPRPERCPKCSPLIPSEPKDPKKPEKGRVSEWLNPTDAEAGLRAPDGRSVRAYTARKEGGKGGLSGKVRFLADECSDIPDVDREAWAGNLVGGGKVMGFGNLLHVHGWFAQAFRPNSKESARWSKLIQKSSRLSPNCPGRVEWSDGKVTVNETIDRPVRGMADRAGIESNLRAWKGTNYICARIDATPPEIVPGQLASLDTAADAARRWNEGIRAEGRLQIGVDVGRSRDPIAIAPRRGRRILEVHAEVLNQDDHVLGALRVAEFARKHRATHERKPLIVFDKSGKEGQDFAVAMREYADEFDIVGVVATHRPRDWKRYDKLRDEVAYHFSEWLKTGAIPADAELEAEIDATTAEEVEVSYGGSGMRWRVQRVVENDALRKILGRSPNKRNACELAVWAVDLGEDSADEPLPKKDELNLAPKPRKPVAASNDDRYDDIGYWGAADAGMQAAWGHE